jgi:predicted N-acyltransferase
LNTHTYLIYSTVHEIPKNWDDIASSNIFLHTKYLKILTESAPENMQCFFVGLFVNQELAGIALMQWIDLSQIRSVGNGKVVLQNKFRDFIMNLMASRVLFVGNNMLSGQNAFARTQKITEEKTLFLLQKASNDLVLQKQKDGFKTHLVSFKDFEVSQKTVAKQYISKHCYCFEIQPNMVFNVKNHWNSFDDYVADLTKKYRDQYKRARKKALPLQKRKLGLEDLVLLQDRMHELYYFVAKQASFNTFFLPSNHWIVFKENLQEDFLVYGYFKDDLLIGFNTLVRNGNHMETYFLGYDIHFQKEYMLYLNMLYDMIAFSVNQGFLSVNFGRTALEIKSSVGAIAVPLHGFILHNNRLVNPLLKYFFNWLEPKVTWEQRSPFRDTNT